MREGKIEVSVIVPAYNEEENIPLLMDEFAEMLNQSGLNCEVVLVDDGSDDGTYEKSLECEREYPFLRTFRHTRNRGITDSLITGFDAARGDIYVFFPADLQYSPRDIPRLIQKVREGWEVVTGWKVGRYEKRFVSSVYNYLSRKLFKVPVHDLNSIKAFTKEVVDRIPLRREWHRYMVVLANEKGFDIGEVQVELYPRRFGRTKFGFWRIPVGILDLVAVKFQLSFTQKPFLLFGSLGGVSLVLGLLVGIVALILRFGFGRGFRPLLYLVILLTLGGLSLFALGFLAEMLAGISDRIERVERKISRR